MESKNKKVAGIVIGVVGVIGGAWLAFGYFGIQKAFTDDEVSEAGPVFESGAGQATGSTETKGTGNGTSADSTGQTQEKSVPTVLTSFKGSFSGNSNYSVSGNAEVQTDGAQTFLRFNDDFNSSNGPDLKVYLRAADGEFVDLGALKGNIGSQNYEVDQSVDLSKYSKVEIWCQRFSVGFGSADLKPA